MHSGHDTRSAVWLIAGQLPDGISRQSPKALVTYVHTLSGYADLHPGVDFLLTTFESWRRSVGHFPQRKLDIVAVASPAAVGHLMQHRVIARLCQQMTLARSNAPQLIGLETVNTTPQSQCWLIASEETTEAWGGFPFVLDFLHHTRMAFQSFTQHMNYTMLLQVCHSHVHWVLVTAECCKRPSLCVMHPRK